MSLGDAPIRTGVCTLLPGGCSRQTGYDACILPRSPGILQFAE